MSISNFLCIKLYVNSFFEPAQIQAHMFVDEYNDLDI